MKFFRLFVLFAGCVPALLGLAAAAVFPVDPGQILERTCFQTGNAWSGAANLRSDVAIVYGIDPGLPQRIQTWREHGYRIHVMTGVSWGNYQDYLYGRFDGVNHEDEAQTERNGQKISHGGDVYYMCSGTNYGKFLCIGVQRALDAGAEAIHLEEPEFWVRAGYSEGFKREWKNYYGEEWQPPHSSPDAQWRTSKLKYFLYRRALQQVFDYVRAYNERTGRQVRCYVPTHSLLSYSHWRIVSPESSLAELRGCDGYIAQVWTGTARSPIGYRGRVQERTFENAFLEYGAMRNLVMGTTRQLWVLNDPVEDNPNHDWDDYRRNWESTLVASLLHPEVWQFEVAPWPERIFAGKYPKRENPAERESIPGAYATELQIVFNALNDLKQPRFEWDCGTRGVGVLISDSLMFQRGDPAPGDPALGHFYGLALPLLKSGMPVTPAQLENVGRPGYLDDFRVLLLSYQGMKPLNASVHPALAAWVQRGGGLLIVDDDSDPYHRVREWWNSGTNHFQTPREHLFQVLKIDGLAPNGQPQKVKRGWVAWIKENPARLAAEKEGAAKVLDWTRTISRKTRSPFRECNYLLLRRGPYVIAAGLDESVEAPAKVIRGRFVNLFDPELRVRNEVALVPGTRWFLRALNGRHPSKPSLLAAGCKAQLLLQKKTELKLAVEGVADTPGIVLLEAPRMPKRIQLGTEVIDSFEYSAADGLLWIRFPNMASPREMLVEF